MRYGVKGIKKQKDGNSVKKKCAFTYKQVYESWFKVILKDVTCRI